VIWIKATIETPSQGIETITALLLSVGIYSVEINDCSEIAALISNTSSHWDYIDDDLIGSLSHKSESAVASVIFYLGTDSESQDVLTHIQEKLSCIQEFVPILSTEVVNDQDWVHEWKKHFHPIRVGRVLIVPEWETVDNKDGIVFTLDPGSAFGTGQHATTMLCIEALQKHLQIGDKILDIGCGSGILSIVGLLLGAKHAVACDIDPSAVEITRKNASLNSINSNRLDVYAGDILSNLDLKEKITCYPFNIVVANIVADVIISLASSIRELLANGGIFIASGIITERLEDVLLALKGSNLTVLEVKNSEGWCCVIAHE